MDFGVDHTTGIALLIKYSHLQQVLHPAGSPFAGSAMSETYGRMLRSGCADSGPGPRTVTLSKK